MKAGDKVHFIPNPDGDNFFYENGIVKKTFTNQYVFVVFHCDNNWNDYENYTAELTSVRNLKPGWRDAYGNAGN